MNRVPGSTTLLLPSNVYPKRNASPKRHIQQIVITQSTTTFAQSAEHHQNNQHRQNHFNVLNSLEGTPEKEQTGFHLRSLKDGFINSDPFKKYQRNLKRFQFNQKPVQDPPPLHPPDEELVQAKLVPDIREPDPDSRPIQPASHNYYGSNDCSDEDYFNTAENIPVRDVETVHQKKTAYIQEKDERIDNYQDIETEASDNESIYPGKEIYDSLNYSDGVDSVVDVKNQLDNWSENRPMQKAISDNHFNRNMVQIVQKNTPFYQIDVVPKYSRPTGESGSSFNHLTTSRRDPITKTAEPITSNEPPEQEEVSNLAPCRYCKRKFAKNRLKTHEEICERTLNKQRNKYDALRHRLKGTDIEVYKKGDTGETRKQGRQDIGRKTSSRFGNADTSVPKNITSGTRSKPEQSQSTNRKPPARANSTLNSSKSFQEDKTERGRKGDVGRSVVTSRKSLSKFEEAPTPKNKLGSRQAYTGSQIEITKKPSAKAANAQSRGDRIGTRGRVNSARQSDVNRKPSGTFEDTPALVSKYGPRPKAGTGSRSNVTRPSNSLFEDPPVGDKFENRDLNKKGSKSPTRSLPTLNKNKR